MKAQLQATKGKSTSLARRKPQVASGVYAKSETVLAVRHRKVQYMVRALKRQMPWLMPSDLPAMRAFCELEYFCAAIAIALDKGKSLFDAEGAVRRLGHDYRKFRQTQMAYMRELGMTPAARLALKASSRDAPYDLPSRFTGDGTTDEQIEQAIAVGKASRPPKPLLVEGEARESTSEEQRAEPAEDD